MTYANNENEDSLNEIEVEIGNIHKSLEEWRHRACIHIYRAVKKGGKVMEKRRVAADQIERRAAGLVRRMERLIVLREQSLSTVSYIRLPIDWNMTDLEKALLSIGATKEERPTGIDDGTGRRKPPLEF